MCCWSQVVPPQRRDRRGHPRRDEVELGHVDRQRDRHRDEPTEPRDEPAGPRHRQVYPDHVLDGGLDAVVLQPRLVGDVLRRRERPLALDTDVEDRLEHLVDHRGGTPWLGVGLLERRTGRLLVVVPEPEDPHVSTSRRPAERGRAGPSSRDRRGPATRQRHRTTARSRVRFRLDRRYARPHHRGPVTGVGLDEGRAPPGRRRRPRRRRTARAGRTGCGRRPRDRGPAGGGAGGPAAPALAGRRPRPRHFGRSSPRAYGSSDVGTSRRSTGSSTAAGGPTSRGSGRARTGWTRTARPSRPGTTCSTSSTAVRPPAGTGPTPMPRSVPTATCAPTSSTRPGPPRRAGSGPSPRP